MLEAEKHEAGKSKGTGAIGGVHRNERGGLMCGARDR